MSERRSIQEQIPDNHCYGCGPLNAKGLGIHSYWDGDETVCEYTPEAHHAAGPTHILNGGIIATLIDCHGICTAIADTYRRAGRELGSAPLIWYATGKLEVSYKRPTPIEGPVILRASVESSGEKKSVVNCTMICQGQETATGVVLAVRVPLEWRGG